MWNMVELSTWNTTECNWPPNYLSSRLKLKRHERQGTKLNCCSMGWKSKCKTVGSSEPQNIKHEEHVLKTWKWHLYYQEWYFENSSYDLLHLRAMGINLSLWGWVHKMNGIWRGSWGGKLGKTKKELKYIQLSKKNVF